MIYTTHAQISRKLLGNFGIPNVDLVLKLVYLIFLPCVPFSHLILMPLGQSRSTFPSFRTYAL